MTGSTRNNERSGGRGAFWAICALLVFAIAFGGGGSKYGLANLTVILASLVALSFHRTAFFAFWRSAPLLLRGLIAISIFIPAAYLIPLPPSVWSAMPGRDLVAQSFDLIGYDGGASASVNPMRTLMALTALITPLAVLTIGWTVPRDKLIVAAWVAVALGLFNFLLGVPQVLSNSEAGVLYPENPMPGVLFGTFANRNSTGLFLVAALALASLMPLPPRARQFSLPLRLGICAALILAIVLTRSRTALVLALIPLCMAGLKMALAHFRRKGGSQSEKAGKIMPITLGVVLVSVVVGSIFVAAPGRLSESFSRFSTDRDDPRAYIWDDASYAAQRYWPIGSGPGTFDEVFQIDESLENITMKRAGRAHNDYLEVAIETGAPGLAVIVGWLILLIWLGWCSRTSDDRWIAWSGGIILLAIALQSITDYPLRNQSLLAIGAFALLILTRFSQDRREARS